MKKVLLFLFVLMLVILTACGGPKTVKVDEDVASEAALELAEQDLGYKIELTSYEIVDSFKAESEVPATGKTVSTVLCLVILEGDVKDAAGNTSFSVLYGVSVADPEKSGQYVIYNTAFSTANDYSGHTKEEVREELQRFGAQFGRKY